MLPDPALALQSGLRNLSNEFHQQHIILKCQFLDDLVLHQYRHAGCVRYLFISVSSRDRIPVVNLTSLICCSLTILEVSLPSSRDFCDFS